MCYKGGFVLADNCPAALALARLVLTSMLQAPQALSTRVKGSQRMSASSVTRSHQAETECLAKVTTRLISPRAAGVLLQTNSVSPGDLCSGTVSHANPENCRDNEGLLPKCSGGERGHEPHPHTHSGSPSHDLQPPRGPIWSLNVICARITDFFFFLLKKVCVCV